MQHVLSRNEHVRYFCQSRCSVSYKHTLEAFLSVHSTVICSLHKRVRDLVQKTATQHLQRLYARAGIAGATSHSGRRTWLTTLSQKGVSVFVLADMAGHCSIQTTQRYVTVNDEMKRNAAELI